MNKNMIWTFGICKLSASKVANFATLCVATLFSLPLSAQTTEAIFMQSATLTASGPTLTRLVFPSGTLPGRSPIST
jgi:hypothetical protein